MTKTVLITGSSRGIGRAIALKYATLGYQIALNCSRDTDRMEEAKKEVRCLGAPCLAIQADVGKKEDCIRLFDTVLHAFGPVDILVNNAGISRIGLLQDMEYEEWDRLLSVNLSSVFYCCKLAIPGMVRKQSGSILNISSVWGICGASCEAAYSASKGGVNALTRALAKELAPSHIQVNAIACGAIDTEMNRGLSAEEHALLLEGIPAGRMGTAEEAADLAIRLTGASSYLTGQIITLDGGWI
ncbi:MAG: SDR family NAD(P)-dependent oxidoreductase [Lachnospiraceae bacterium]|nr:SDR family NAD(P)-dependent oxidoreductase [Lachnospiraceae bacterium]